LRGSHLDPRWKELERKECLRMLTKLEGQSSQLRRKELERKECLRMLPKFRGVLLQPVRNPGSSGLGWKTALRGT